MKPLRKTTETEWQKEEGHGREERGRREKKGKVSKTEEVNIKGQKGRRVQKNDTIK